MPILFNATDEQLIQMVNLVFKARGLSAPNRILIELPPVIWVWKPEPTRKFWIRLKVFMNTFEEYPFQYWIGFGRYVDPQWHGWAKQFPQYENLVRMAGIEDLIFINCQEWMTRVLGHPDKYKDWSFMNEKQYHR